jgi:hypothetical protein
LQLFFVRIGEFQYVASKKVWIAFFLPNAFSFTGDPQICRSLSTTILDTQKEIVVIPEPPTPLRRQPIQHRRNRAPASPLSGRPRGLKRGVKEAQ